jgi:hypothetical protein
MYRIRRAGLRLLSSVALARHSDIVLRLTSTLLAKSADKLRV